jgi:hypothetical protein
MMLNSVSLQRVFLILTPLLPYGYQLVFLHPHEIDTLTILATTVRHCNALRTRTAVVPTPVPQETPPTPLPTQSPVSSSSSISISSSSSCCNSNSSSNNSNNNVSIRVCLLETKSFKKIIS